MVRSAKSDTPGAVKVETTDKEGKGTGEYTYQVHSGTVTGRIVSTSEQQDEFDGNVTTKFILTLRHPSAGDINVTIPEGRKYWMAFMNAAPNIDPAKPITLSPYDYVNKQGARKIGLGVKQDDNDVPWKYVKDTPDGPPQLQPVMLANGKPFVKGGKTVYDWDPIIEWYKANVLLDLEARVIKALESHPISVISTPEPEPNDFDDMMDNEPSGVERMDDVPGAEFDDVPY